MRRMAVVALLVTGCELFQPFRRTDENPNIVKTGEIRPVSQANAERLDRVGRQIISTNPFLGFAPTFALIGSVEPEIFHPNGEAVFVSEGVLAQAESDDVLAGVLCLELARLNAEARNVTQMGLVGPNTELPGPEVEPDPDQADLGGAETVGANRRRASELVNGSIDEVAKKWHKAAGYKPEAFAAAVGIDRKAVAGTATSKLLLGQGPVPRWTK